MRFVQQVLRGSRMGAVALGLCGSLLAQEPAPAPQTPSPSPGNSQPAPGAGGVNPGTQQPQPGRSPFPTDQQRMPQRMPEMPRSIFLSGRVMLDDGTPPPEPVTIERVCNGSPRPEGYTDSKGRFSFELGRNTAAMADASTSGGFEGLGQPNSPTFGGGGFGGMSGGQNIERMLMGCELRASFPGFRSDNINLAGRRMLDNPDVGTIVLHRLANVEGFTFSATSGLAPKDARKAYEKSKDLLRKKKLPEAKVQLEKATSIYPKYAAAWYDLGRVLEANKELAEAKKAYEASIEADRKYVNPYLNLSGLYARESNWEKTAELSAQAVRLNPFEFPQMHFFNAVANLNLNKLDDAEKSAREARRLDPKSRFPKIDHVLGIILAEKRDIPGAAESLRAYLKASPDAPDAENIKKQLEQLEKAVAAGQ